MSDVRRIWTWTLQQMAHHLCPSKGHKYADYLERTHTSIYLSDLSRPKADKQDRATP